MLGFIITAIKVIFLLGFLIFIHEGGHFLVAKLCKIKVLEFSIGFGPTIWKKQGKETLYALRLIPLGGFVNLEGEEKEVDSDNSFSNASIPKRMAIIVAGATVNILFGIIIYFILMTCTGNNTSLIVDDVIPSYSAEQYGILPNDEIIKANNMKIKTKNDLDKIVQNSNNNEIILTIKRKENIETIKILPTKNEYKSTGIYLKTDGSEIGNKIISIDKNSPAEKSGLKINDKIIKINNIEIKNGNDIVNEIQNNEDNQQIKLTVKRGTEQLEIELIPEVSYSYILGVKFKPAENNLTNNLYYAVFETRDFLFTIGDSLKQIFTGKVQANQLMGPVGISGAVANTKKVEEFLYLMSLISISLGVTNLIPFPALDGGKFALLIIELIRGKKINEQTEINIQLIGFSILITVAIYVTYNDILRML